MKRIAISINGGGALGIGPLAFMCRLESEPLFGKSVSKRAFALAGTSTGAIIAACLAEGMSAHDTFELYRKNLKSIFTEYPWYDRMKPGCPTYSNANLKRLLQENLSGPRGDSDASKRTAKLRDTLQENLSGNCGDWDRPVFIPTTFMNGPSVEKVWDRGDTDVPKWFAVLTSTAAPTYFDVIVDDKGNSYCDGGLWCNDPIMTLQAGLAKGGERDYKILSFDTGMSVPNTDTGNKTMLGWGKYILKNWVARSGMSNYYEACANLGEKNVFRVSPSISKPFEMDDTSDKTIQKVIEIWDSEYSRLKPKLLEFLNA